MKISHNEVKKAFQLLIEWIKKHQTILLACLAGVGFILFFITLSLYNSNKFHSQNIITGKTEMTGIFSSQGKTWVAFDEPVVKVEALTMENCELCGVDETLTGLKRLVPTVDADKIDVNSPEGKNIVRSLHITSVPAFIFSREVEETQFFAQAKALFQDRGEAYVLRNSQLGIPTGQFLRTPEITSGDVVVGPSDAKVTLVEFSDFQCPFCKVLHQTIKKELGDYAGKIRYVYKNFPINSAHPRSESAALAAECANEQGKFMAYADTLFANQAVWSKSQEDDIFSGYAQNLKMDLRQFSDCMKSGKYQTLISSDRQEGEYFDLPGTPALFVNNQLLNGVINANNLKKIIEDSLNK